MIAEKSDRAKAFVQLYRDGWTKVEIARAFGLSRERVRQVLEKRGEPTRTRGLDPAAALAAARRARSAYQTTLALRTSWPRVQDALTEAGALPALRRLWRWRTRRAQRKFTYEQLVATIQKLGADLGRAPSARDLRHSGTSVGVVLKYFTSLAAAQEAAGFTPRKVGDYRGCRPRAVSDIVRVRPSAIESDTSPAHDA